MNDHSLKDTIAITANSLNLPVPGTGLVVGVIQGDRFETFGYGQISDDRHDTPNEDTLFEIGSVTKVFTTSLLSILAFEEIIDINGAVRDLVPSLPFIPPEITLLELATHTSGLPKMPSNIWSSMRKDFQNPYANYSKDDLFEYLTKFSLRGKWKSTEVVNYSNVGMALLGEALSLKIGVSYEQAILDKICRPLGMFDTIIQLSPEQEARLATPHTPNGRKAKNWDLTAFSGAGALRSTASDLSNFLIANLGTKTSSIAEPLQGCHEIQSGTFPMPGFFQKLISRLSGRSLDLSHRERNIALGWHVGKLDTIDKQIFWRRGGTSGYRAMIIFCKEPPKGVTVLANSGPERKDLLLNNTSTDDLGFRLLEHLIREDLELVIT